MPVVPGPFIHSFTGHGGSRGSAVVPVKDDGRRGLSLSLSLSLSVSVSVSVSVCRLCVSVSLVSLSRRSGSLIGFITVMDSAVSQSEVRHLHVMTILIFFSPKPTQRAFIATSDHRKINEKRCINSFKQYNTSVSGVVSLLKINDWGGQRIRVRSGLLKKG